MLVLNVLVFFCFWLVTMQMAETSYSNCPRVSISGVTTSPGCESGNKLRARLPQKTVPNKPRRLDAGGRKEFSKRTAFYLYVHRKPGTSTRYISIHLARDHRYTLAEENGQLWFINVTNPQSTMPAAKFLFKRDIHQGWDTIQSILSKRYISIVEKDCSVSLIYVEEKPRSHRFNVRCKRGEEARCYCFPN